MAVVESINTIGYSATSAENTLGALVQVVPAAPPSAPTRGEGTNESQLEVLYEAYADDGGSAILAYVLELDRGQGAGFEEVDASRVNTFIINDGTIDSGVTYTVRYRSQNVHGDSAYSPELEIIAATVPSAPTAVTVANSVDDSTTTVRVSWTAPAVYGGDGIPILAYRILFR